MDPLFAVEIGLIGTNDMDALEPLRERFASQHYSLRKFYYECSNLKYLTGLINVPKLGQVGVFLRTYIILCLIKYLGPTELDGLWRCT